MEAISKMLHSAKIKEAIIVKQPLGKLELSSFYESIFKDSCGN